jgi:GNAT superfamily N-acetyltransferase
MVIQAALDFARNRNCYKVMLLSSARRTEAHRFYETLGFSSTDKAGFVMHL